VVGLGLRFKKSGLDLDRKIWQSAHLCTAAHAVQTCHVTASVYCGGPKMAPHVNKWSPLNDAHE